LFPVDTAKVKCYRSDNTSTELKGSLFLPIGRSAGQSRAFSSAALSHPSLTVSTRPDPYPM